MPEKYDYDAIIIGAGISGLVCGCYLAKAGLKTLIVEKNPKPGGYCSSFVRQGFHFDSCVHAISSLRKGGLLNRLFTEIGVIDRIKFNRHSPSDVIVTPDFKIKIFPETNSTAEEFKRIFSKEKRGIENFFKYIASSSFLEARSITFECLLDSFFKDPELKNIFSTIIFLIVGCLPSKVSATVACLLCKEFILDGGYYPIGGIQQIPDVLLERFIELKGDILLSGTVTKIETKNNKAIGISLDNNKRMSCYYVVSSSDIKHAYFNLIGRNNIEKPLFEKIDSLNPSTSGFIVYLGINKKLSDNGILKSNIYLITNKNSNRLFKDVKKCRNDFVGIHTPSVWDSSLNQADKESICIATNANFENKKFWNKENKDKFADRLIKLSETVIPNLSKIADLKIIATPGTLFAWTGNFQGAAYGWASTPEQFGNPDISQKTKIENFYITGHWSNQSSGVSFVANCGRDTADMILRNKKVKR